MKSLTGFCSPVTIKIMHFYPNDDNIYKEGTTIAAKANPGVKLTIEKYLQRIYYCSVVGRAEEKQLVYFERELIPPDPRQ